MLFFTRLVGLRSRGCLPTGGVSSGTATDAPPLTFLCLLRGATGSGEVLVSGPAMSERHTDLEKMCLWILGCRLSVTAGQRENGVVRASAWGLV